MKKILVPCDFSTPAQEAFKFAVKIATRSNGEIHVLYVLDLTSLHGTHTVSQSYAFNINFLKETEKDGEAKFQVMWERYSPLTLPVKFKHSVGSLLPDVERYIHDNAIDLVVIGTHGYNEAAWGSNAERVVRNSPVPVIAIGKAPEREIRKIIVPLMPYPLDHDFCTKLKQVQSFFDATLCLLWVNTPRILRNDSDTQRELQRIATEANFTDYTINIRSDYNVEDGVRRFAREMEGDMIAMGTHAWKGLAHFFTGSVTEDIVHPINIPIWTYALK